MSAPGLAQGAEYLQRLEHALIANGLDGKVELEVTERVIMSGLAENVATLDAMGKLGVRFAIDDFGTGYSSLAYLRSLPIDKLKIDRSFLSAIDSQGADAAIVRAITARRRHLGISVAAEGVETAAQLERLLAFGCEEWQGHYFSAPLDTAGFEGPVRVAVGAPRAARRPESGPRPRRAPRPASASGARTSWQPVFATSLTNTSMAASRAGSWLTDLI